MNRELSATTFLVYLAAWFIAIIAAWGIASELAARRPRPSGTEDDDGAIATMLVIVGGAPLVLGLGIVLAAFMGRLTLVRFISFTVCATALLTVVPYLLLRLP